MPVTLEPPAFMPGVIQSSLRQAMRRISQHRIEISTKTLKKYCISPLKCFIFVNNKEVNQ